MTKVLAYGTGNMDQLFPECEITWVDPESSPDEQDWEPGSFDIVYLGHVLQFYPRERVSDIVKQFAVFLRPWGELWAVTPSLEWICKTIWKEDEPGIVPYMMLFGTEQDQHLSGFTMHWLRVALQVSGLTVRKAVSQYLNIPDAEGKVTKVVQNLVIAIRPKEDPAEAIQ